MDQVFREILGEARELSKGSKPQKACLKRACGVVVRVAVTDSCGAKALLLSALPLHS